MKNSHSPPKKKNVKLFFASVMSVNLCAPPQDARVRLSYTAKEEAGRFAVAQRALSPGELVLTAAPYALVMNPKFCPSALYLSSRCTMSSNSSCGIAADSEVAKNGDKDCTKQGKAAKRSGPKHSSSSCCRKGEVESSDATAPYKDALYGEGSEYSNKSNSTATSIRWYTTQSARCAACFCEIPSGRWLCNRGSLAELAVDVSWEQTEQEEKLRRAQEEAAAAARARDAADCKYAALDVLDSDEDDLDAVDDAVGGGTNADDAAAAFRRLKKPAKSAKTRKDGAVELKQRLLDKALAQREEIFYERRLQRQSRAQQGRPAVRLEGWEDDAQNTQRKIDVKEDGADVTADVFAGAMSGCSGCGVLCYCSEACWHAYRTQHEESGECAVLRGLYPRLMSEYYSTGTGTGVSAVTAQGAVVLPGDEPLHWTRSSSEAKMLEFQSLLFSAIVLARACRAGYASHLHTADTTSSREAAVDAKRKEKEEEAKGAANGEASPAADHSVNAGVPASAPLSSPPPPPSVNAVDSSVVPKEVLTIHEIRRKAGLTGTVEVLDSDATLRRAAMMDDARSTPSQRVPFTDTKATTTNSTERDEGDAAGGAAAATHTLSSVSTTAAPSQLYVRLPRYADMGQMETNLSVLSKTRRSTYQRYYRAFTKRVMPTLQLLDLNTHAGNGNVDAEVGENSEVTAAPSTPLRVSASYFLRLCAAAQCNSFGVYDTDGSCLAFGMFPEASYFNHSCVLNICRVMHHGGRVAAFYALRPIAADEPLTICYTDVEQQNSAERRRNLLETYRFFCQCARCSGEAEGPVMAVATSAANVSATAHHHHHGSSRSSNNKSSSGGGGKAPSAGAMRQRSPPVAVSPSLFEKPLLLCAQCAIRGYLRPIPAVQTAGDASSTASWCIADVSLRECTVCHCQVVRDTAAS